MCRRWLRPNPSNMVRFWLYLTAKCWIDTFGNVVLREPYIKASVSAREKQPQDGMLSLI